jgi:hypothetical protein
MALRREEQRECFRDARCARYLARIVGKEGDMKAETLEVEFQQAADDVSLSD